MISQIEDVRIVSDRLPLQMVSIVCPIFNEALAIPIFYERLKVAIAPLHSNIEFEVIFTNNCSTDNSLSCIRLIRDLDERVQVLTLSRNFGYQASVLAGISYANGDAIIVIDVDCEDPPELIPVFIQKWLTGADIVYGERGNRPEPRPLLLARKFFYVLLKAISDTDIILDMAEFALVSRRVRDVMIANRNSFPFLRAEIGYAGFQRESVKYDRQKRTIGKSYYNLSGMFLFAIAGILSVSTFLLRIGAYLWPGFALLNIGFLVADVIESLSLNIFKYLVILDLFYLVTLVTALGLYQARIYKNNLARPVYIIDHEFSFTNRKIEMVNK
jgi:glycosyltransferase involved in cell wall biosynthesis